MPVKFRSPLEIKSTYGKIKDLATFLKKFELLLLFDKSRQFSQRIFIF